MPVIPQRLLYFIKRALQTPPHITVVKASCIIKGMLGQRYQQMQTRRTSTFLTNAGVNTMAAGSLSRFMAALAEDDKFQARAILSPYVNQYMNHKFDLLGSGWVKVYHGMQANGIEGTSYPAVSAPDDYDRLRDWLLKRTSRANQSEVSRLRDLITPAYQPIDWHIDFKSGYRWSEDTFSPNLSYGNKPGADIKVPWELGRLQHLPQLALAAAAGGIKNQYSPEELQCEFCNQILDFIAANPPGYGVNWVCTMDVAIRAANLCLAYDIFIANSFSFPEEIILIIKRSLLEHGLHITNHLEWHPDLRGNHYLADICGLIFVAAYLPVGAQTNRWMAFALQQLTLETEHQFTPDGANFEASTCYHLLSSQMVAAATAITLGLDEEKRRQLMTFSNDWPHQQPALLKAPLPLYATGACNETPFSVQFTERLLGMEAFTRDMTKPSGRVVQIGDNDSGRFLKLVPCDAYASGREDLLDPRPVRAGLQALFGGFSDDISNFPPAALEGKLLRQLFSSPLRQPESQQKRPSYSRTQESDKLLPDNMRREITIALPGNSLFEGLESLCYPDFGFFLWRSTRLWLSIRCGPIGQDDNGGHAHNDHLAIELVVDNEEWITDPGAYLYTPFPEIRNAYRSRNAHFVPGEGPEPSRLNQHLFSLENNAHAQCLHFTHEMFSGRHEGLGGEVYREICLRPFEIVIRDHWGEMQAPEVNPQIVKIDLPTDLRKLIVKPMKISYGYGQILEL